MKILGSILEAHEDGSYVLVNATGERTHYWPVNERIEALERQFAEARAIIEAVEAAASGKPVSDFLLSMPVVRLSLITITGRRSSWMLSIRPMIRYRITSRSRAAPSRKPSSSW